MVSGPSSVIESIAAGRQGAISIDKYLGGRGVMEEQIAPQEDPTLLPPLPEEEEEKRRPLMRSLSPKKRLQGFMLVERGFSEVQAREEALRCLPV